jgi:hypothetical protein
MSAMDWWWFGAGALAVLVLLIVAEQHDVAQHRRHDPDREEEVRAWQRERFRRDDPKRPREWAPPPRRDDGED